MSTTAEFHFELRVCEWAERNWHPTLGRRPVIVSRQLGTKYRRWDTVIVEVDPDGLVDRREFGTRRLDRDLLRVVPAAPQEWAWYRDVLSEPPFPWRYLREAVKRAGERGLVKTRRRNNRIQFRRVRPYPEWIRRLVAIEHKPDLDAAAADQLTVQLQRDVAIALADEAWIATGSDTDTVGPSLVTDAPPEVGILEFDTETSQASVTWKPRSLSVSDTGTRIVERPSRERGDLSAARFEYVDPDEKHLLRQVIAERAYERGWRSYVETMRPDCRYFQLHRENRGCYPYCTAKNRPQTSIECSEDCESFEPEPPEWRQRGPPLEGGPGVALQRLLDQRRERRRP